MLDKRRTWPFSDLGRTSRVHPAFAQAAAARDGRGTSEPVPPGSASPREAHARAGHPECLLHPFDPCARRGERPIGLIGAARDTGSLDDLNEQAAAVDFARRLVPHCHEALGTELLGVYLIGSLVHGGFGRRYSDVDLALVREAGLSPQALDRIRTAATAQSADWAAKLSVFWTNRHFTLGRFPPLDRIDYLDRAAVLMEREHVRPVRPTLEDIRRYLTGAPFSDWADRARHFASSVTLEPKDHKPYLKTLLYPARFCYGWITGRMGSNDDAVTFLRERHPVRLDVELIDRALQCRRAAADLTICLRRARCSHPSSIPALPFSRLEVARDF